MSAKLVSAIWDYVFDLEGVDQRTAREILMAIADHADRNAENAWPSVATIARKISIDGERPEAKERTVRRTLAALRKRGVLLAMRKPGFHHPTTYRVALGALTRKAEKGDAQMTPITREKGDTQVSSMKGDTKPEKGDTRGQKGDTLMTAEHPSESSYEPYAARSSSQDGAGLKCVCRESLAEHEPQPPRKCRRDICACDEFTPALNAVPA